MFAGRVKAKLVVKGGNAIHLAGRDRQVLCDHLHGNPGQVSVFLLNRLENGNEVSSRVFKMRQHGRYLFDHCSFFAIQFGGCHVCSVKVICLYPEGGTSDVQRLQMVTEDADNLKVVGIKGVFDDAQNALKRLLGSEKFRATLEAENTFLSAANSVNMGRIIFQLIYHIHAYLQLVHRNEISLGELLYTIQES